MTPLPHDQDITSWPQILTAIEDAEAGQGTARLTEICLSVYSALAAAQFQITQLKARVHVLATSRPCPHADPMAVAGSRLPPPARTVRSQGEHTMGLPAGEQRVLDTIENELGSPISSSRLHLRPSPDSPAERVCPGLSG
jgi:hypothetical protein